MLKRFLYMIKEPTVNSLNENNLKSILSTIKILITDTNVSEDLVKLGQYLVSLLPNLGCDESNISLENSQLDSNFNLIYTIKLRNKLLAIIDEIVSQDTCTKSINFQEELQRMLGLDWFMLFMQPAVHKTTVIKATKILFTLLLNVQNLNRFKESIQFGGWLNNVFVQPNK